MSEEGKNIFNAVKQVREFFEKISLLLTTTDALMKEYRWLPAQGTTARSYGSATLHTPKQWLPYEIFRFYKNDEYKNLLICISVILDDLEGKYSIKEPLICGSIFDYLSGNDVGDSWETWYARWHLSSPTRKDDGTFTEFDPNKNLHDEKSHKVMHISTMALPLVNISDANKLEERIINPLIGRIS
ncbi:MAG: hypothetical protein IH948_09005 [Bacteroidetes bacterium]|nr:hypothetical protein [Bacteroidota bacterium]